MPGLAALGRMVLGGVLVASLWQTVQSARDISTNPTLTPVIARGAAEIVAITDRMMARAATPDRLNALIAHRLAERPRNWVALQALADVAAERDIPLPPAYQTALDEGSGLLAAALDCAACMADVATCTLSTGLMCKAPILLTPLEDVRGLIQAGWDFSTGEPIDRLDLGLSVVGLGATAALIATGGSSGTLKAGSATIRLARGMGRLSPALTTRLTSALTDGIRWADLPAARSADDLAALVRVDVLKPLAATLSDLGRMAEATGPTQALHLLPLVDDATDAKWIADASQALGPRLVARAEVLGKTRLLRATLRYGETTLRLMAGLLGALLSGTMLLAGVVQTILLRRLRRGMRVT